MSGYVNTEMPSAARTARLLMSIQAGLSALGIVLLLVLVTNVRDGGRLALGLPHQCCTGRLAGALSGEPEVKADVGTVGRHRL